MKNIHPEFLMRDGNPMFAVLPIEEFNYIVKCLEKLDLLVTGVAKVEEEADKAISLDQARELLEREY